MTIQLDSQRLVYAYATGHSEHHTRFADDLDVAFGGTNTFRERFLATDNPEALQILMQEADDRLKAWVEGTPDKDGIKGTNQHSAEYNRYRLAAVLCEANVQLAAAGEPELPIPEHFWKDANFYLNIELGDRTTEEIAGKLREEYAKDPDRLQVELAAWEKERSILRSEAIKLETAKFASRVHQEIVERWHIIADHTNGGR
jgi:hypothetical protein